MERLALTSVSWLQRFKPPCASTASSSKSFIGIYCFTHSKRSASQKRRQRRDRRLVRPKLPEFQTIERSRRTPHQSRSKGICAPRSAAFHLSPFTFHLSPLTLFPLRLCAFA